MSDLTLSGWTQPADALSILAPEAAVFDYSDYPSPEASFAGLEKFEHTECVIGWSMGGQLALRAIMAGVLKPKHLTLIASSYQFVTNQAVSQAMDPLTFTQFRENYATNPARTKTRFHALTAKGDKNYGEVLAMLRHHPDVENTARWLPWLDDLGQYSFAGADFSKLPPTLIVHGENDAVVSYHQGEHFSKSIPHAELHLWEETCHAPHLHDTARLRAEIADHRQRMAV